MGITVLSLCDGMSCGRMAFEKAGIPVDKYFAAEIKDIAIKATRHNFPDTIHIGDVNKIKYDQGVLYTENGNFEIKIDVMIFGSPCQSFSRAMNSNMRVGLQDKQRSGLFLECYRVMKEVRPKYFLLENVIMRADDRDYISHLMGVPPIRINSSLVSAQLRDRLYWTNIPEVTIPQDRQIHLNTILDSGYSDRDKARALLVSDSRPLKTPEKILHRYWGKGFGTVVFQNYQHYVACKQNYDTILGGRKPSAELWNGVNVPVFRGIRQLNKYERARLQTVPEHYVDCMTEAEAADLCGDGWTVDVIAHIFSQMPRFWLREAYFRERGVML